MGKRGPISKKKGLKVQSGQLPMNREFIIDLLKPYDPPICPEHFTEPERNIWNITIDLLKVVRSIQKCDQAILAAYCNSYARWIAAEKDIQKIALQSTTSGLVMKGTQNLVINPLINISRRAQADMVFYAAQLGMTPRSRMSSNSPEGVRDNPFLRIKNADEVDR